MKTASPRFQSAPVVPRTPQPPGPFFWGAFCVGRRFSLKVAQIARVGRSMHPMGHLGRCDRRGSPIPWPGELGRGVWVPRVSGKRGARELERASSQSYSARNCDIYPVPRRFPVARQPHSHRFCASTGDRKSNHQVAPIVCSQFALLSPDSATSPQSIAL